MSRLLMDGERTPADTAAADDEVDQLLATVLELQPSEHDEALAGLCREHPAHASQLRARYRALEAVGLVGAADAMPAGFPTRLGEFSLGEPLGGGGMGVVYRAIEEPLQREVALKLIRPEHLYFPGARQWFRREVEAIASLQHPGIVPVYRVGEARGIPFFVMELVQGASLAHVIRCVQRVPQERLGAADLARAVGEDQRAALGGAFALGTWHDACVAVALQIADALAHAHARGIVHRDVKPSNVMLTPDGRARLLDFGLASREGSAKLTRTGVAMGSLAYMSPEQVRGEVVDGRTDVYSLGVTLYELLTLQEPYYDESSDVVRSQILRGQPKPIRLLNRKVPWDVETVCLRAMAVEPHHRYASAEALADDLRNLLRRQPIRARRAGLVLRLKRLVQRHPTASAALVLGALSCTLLPTALWLQQRSANAAVRSALGRAEAEAETSRRAIDFLVESVRLADPERTSGETFTVRQMVDEAALRLRTDLRDQPRVQSALLAAIGRVYDNLGLFDRAVELLEQTLPALADLPHGEAFDVRVVLARVQRALGRTDRARSTLQSAAAAGLESVPLASLAAWHIEHAWLAYERGSAADAFDHLDRAERACRQDPRAAAPLLEVLRTRVRVLTRDESYRDALALLPRVEELADRLLGEDSAARAALHHDRGRALRAAGKPVEALDALRAAETALSRIFGAEHLDVAEVRESRAFALADLGRYQEGRVQLEEAARIRRAVLHAEHPSVARNLCLQGEMVLGSGDGAEAEALFARAEEILQRAPAPPRRLLASVAAQRSIAASRAGKPPEALAHADRARRLYDALGTVDEDRAAFLERCTFVLLEGGRTREGRSAAEESLALRRALYPSDHPRIAHSLQVLAQACAFAGDYEAALQHSEAAIVVASARPGGNRQAEVYLAIKAQALAGLERHAEAADAYAAGIDAVVAARGPNERSLIEMSINCGLCLSTAGRLESARERFAEAKRIAGVVLPAEHRVQVTVRRLLGRTLLRLGQPAAALPLCREAVALGEGFLPADDQTLAAARRVLADAIAASEGQ